MPEDLNELRLAVQKAMKTPYQLSAKYKVEIDGQPEDFDMYVKDVSYGIFNLDTEDLNAGSASWVFPQKKEIEEITVTFLDNEDQRIRTWLKDWAEKIVSKDGYVALPSTFVKSMKIYSKKNDNSLSEKPDKKYPEIFPNKIGEVSRSNEEPGFMEFQATFIEFFV